MRMGTQTQNFSVSVLLKKSQILCCHFIKSSSKTCRFKILGRDKNTQHCCCSRTVLIHRPRLLMQLSSWTMFRFVSSVPLQEMDIENQCQECGMKQSGYSARTMSGSVCDRYLWYLHSTYSSDLDKESSFFVGDAAGRPDDHACSDRKWALNAGIRFFTPEVGRSPQSSSSLTDIRKGIFPQGASTGLHSSWLGRF